MIKSKTKFKETELGKIPEDWKIAQISKYFDVSTGKNLLQKDRLEYGDYEIIGANGKIGYSDNYLVDGEYVITGRVGTLGEIYYKNGKFWPSDNLLLISSKSNQSAKFLYYFLKTVDFQSLNVGSTQPLITQTALKNLEIIFPTIEEQRKIAGVLGALDEKIELNRKMNKTLEQIGQAIFKKWFIDNPKKENWSEKRLEDVTDLISRGPNLKYTKNARFPVLNQRCVRNNEIELEAIQYAEELRENKTHLYLKKNDILINSMGEGTLGRISRNLSIDYKMIIHNCITVVRANEKIISQHLLYYQLKNLENDLTSMGSGTTGQTSLKPEIIKNIEIFIPGKELIKKFDDQIFNIWKSISKNKKQIEILSQIRDSLLPRLMNGKLRVR